MELPEGTPTDVALTEVLMASGLLDEQLNLSVDIQRLLVGKVIACSMYRARGDIFNPSMRVNIIVTDQLT